MTKKSILQYEITKKKVKPTELMHFSRQLGAFVRAGIPILDAIDVIAEDMSNKTMREALREVSVSITAGKSFSIAATEHPQVFPSFYVRTLKSAELTGKLDSVLDQLSLYIERDEDAKRKVRAAMVYPGIVLAMAVATVAVMMIFVLPRFETFFASFNATLPLPTRILLAIGDFTTNFWPFIVGGILFVAFSVFGSVKTHGGRHFRDKVILKTPILGEVVRFAVTERFCRILSSLMEAAVPAPEALEVATEGTNNLVYEKALFKARQSMLEGNGLARPIADTGLFPGTVTQMIRVGEETGTLDVQLATAANFYDVELGYKIKRLTTMIEPAIITLVGGIVGFVAIALVSAMYGIYGQVSV